jgi:hypothetical protein
MASYFRLGAEALPDPGTVGAWERRVVEGLANFGSFNGSAIAALSGEGSYLQQLYEAMTPQPSYDGETFVQKICGGGKREFWQLILAEVGGGVSGFQLRSDGSYRLRSDGSHMLRT